MGDGQDIFDKQHNFFYTDIQDLLNLPISDLVPFTESVEFSESRNTLSTYTAESNLLFTNIYNQDTDITTVIKCIENEEVELEKINQTLASTSNFGTNRSHSVIVKNYQNYPNIEKKDVTSSDSHPICGVCGDKAGKHAYYGGVVCGSCRAFFRRSVQSKYHLIFQCKLSKNCEIKSDTKKKCQFCR